MGKIMATTQKGVLSQAIENLKNQEAVIKAFKGLPASATSIQKNVDQVTNNLLPNIIDMQTKVKSLRTTLESQLKKEIAQLDKAGIGASLPQLAKRVTGEITPVKKLTEDTLKKCNATSASINKSSIALQKVSINLNAKIAGLQSSLEGEKRKLDELNKKKIYLIWLGLLGVPGLIALAILLGKAQNTVNALENKKSKLKSQINQHKSFLTQTILFLKDFAQLINKTSGIANTIGFLLGDINDISADIVKGKISDPAQIKLYFTASLMMVNELKTDAS